MCWKVERYYSQCGHWASPIIETFCAKGLSNGVACDDSKVNSDSVPQRRGLCPTCAYQIGRQLPGVALTHRHSDDGPSVPFSRDTLNAKPLAMAKEGRDKLTQKATDSKLSIKKGVEPPISPDIIQGPRTLEIEEVDRQLWEEQESGKELLHERLSKIYTGKADEQERQYPSKPPPSDPKKASQKIPTAKAHIA